MRRRLAGRAGGAASPDGSSGVPSSSGPSSDKAGVGTVVGRVVVGEPQPRRRRDALEVAAGPLGARELVDLRPEVRPVARHQQVGQLVHEHVVDHPRGHALQPGREPDRAVGRRAGPPPAALVGDPADALGPRPAGQPLPGERLGAGQQVGVAGPQPGVLAGQPLEHHRDPLALLGPGHPGRDQDHRAVAVAVGRHRAAAAGAAAHLDLVAGLGVDRVHGVGLRQRSGRGLAGRGLPGSGLPAGHHAETLATFLRPQAVDRIVAGQRRFAR